MLGLKGLDISLAIAHMPANPDELRPTAFGTPTFQGARRNIPAPGQELRAQ
jgi:hypothetical protein